MFKYSIIIPTRDRHETLEYSIKSALSIPRDDIEVFVADNCSSIKTQKIVQSINDRRLVYSRSENRLSMTANFDRGIRLSRGEYITVIGDDDCIIPSILPSIDDHFNTTESEVICWFRYPYFWPNSFENPNLLHGSRSPYFRPIPSQDLLTKALRFYLNYQFLPSFYNSWIHRSVIDRIICFNQNNSISSSIYPNAVISPDVYSSLLILLFTDNFIYSGIPFSLSGISCFSNGMGFKQNNRDSQLFSKEYGHQSQKDLCHPIVRPLLKLCKNNKNAEMSLTIASDYFSFLQTYKHQIKLGNDELLLSVLKALKSVMKWSPKETTQLQKELNIDKQLNDNKTRIGNNHYLSYFYGVPQPKKFSVDSSKWNVKNCYEAMQLYEKILAKKIDHPSLIYNQISTKIKKIFRALM